jgi:hypothetical protein
MPHVSIRDDPARLAAIKADASTFVGFCVHHGDGVARYVRSGVCVECQREAGERRRQGLPPDPARAERAREYRDAQVRARREERNAKKKLALDADVDAETQLAKRMAKINRRFLQLLTFEKLRSIRESA